MADKHTSRYIQYHDRLHRLPPGPLSAKGIFRALAEPWAAPSTTTEETVWDFMARRFGEEVAEKLVSPFVSGIWAGDAKILSMKSAFPSITIHERNHGSVIKGLLFGKKKNQNPNQKTYFL
jgi:oxygen-dependent protoporphyrinogen oxidase